MDSNQFAQTVKQKYPQYAQVPDDVLTQKIVQKYPQYAKAITPGQPQQNQMAQIQPQQAQRPPQQGLGQMDPAAMLKAYARADPQGAQQLLSKLMGSQFGPQDPQKQADLNYTLAQTDKLRQPAKPTSPWRVVPGVLSKSGKPVQQNEQTGEVREATLDVTPTGRGNASYGSNSITWDTATPEDQALAKSLYEGRITPGALSYRDKGVAVKLANEYAIKNKLPAYQSFSGDVKHGMANSLAFGKLGQNALSLNTALGHANSALEAYQNIGNTNAKFLNVPINKLRTQTNDENVIKLQTTLNALSGELATVFKGSAGTDQEIGKWMNVLNDNLTPSQAKGAIQQVNELLNSRLNALQYQQKNVMGGRPDDRQLLSPHAKQLSQKFSSMGNNQLGPTATGPNGKKIRFNGTAWVPM